MAYLQEHLPGVFGARFLDHELQIGAAKKRDIVLEGRKSDKEEGDDIKEAFDGLASEMLENV